jgi:hypothetical protein
MAAPAMVASIAAETKRDRMVVFLLFQRGRRDGASAA